MGPPKRTLYQILGIARDANPIDVGLAHEMRMAELRRAVPPDPSGTALVQQAYEILSNPARREAYDAQLLTIAERNAAASQAETDLEIGEEAPPKRKLPVVPIAIGAVVGAVALFLALRSPVTPAPAETVQPVAAQPEPPPPPKERNAGEIVADVSTSGGMLLGYAMSGAVQPIGMAMAIDTGTMVTTCHGIAVGAKLVVRVGKEQLPADLTITDETLDLCRLAVAGFTTPPLRVATEEPRAGDRIFLVGANARGEFVATEGSVKALRKVPAGRVIELSIPVSPNGSGGGVFDRYGKLVGIATTPHAHGPGLQVALPATWITQMRSRTK